MKRLLTILVVLTLAVTAFAACGKNNGNSQDENDYSVIYSKGSQLNIVLADTGYAVSERASEINRTLLLLGVKSSVVMTDGERIENEITKERVCDE